jgi:hypothetical protein
VIFFENITLSRFRITTLSSERAILQDNCAPRELYTPFLKKKKHKKSLLFLWKLIVNQFFSEVFNKLVRKIYSIVLEGPRPLAKKTLLYRSPSTFNRRLQKLCREHRRWYSTTVLERLHPLSLRCRNRHQCEDSQSPDVEGLALGLHCIVRLSATWSLGLCEPQVATEDP